MEEKYLEQISKIIEENDEIFSSEISSLKVSDFLKLQKAIYSIRKINANYKMTKSTLEGLKDVFTSIQNEIEKSQPIPSFEKGGLDNDFIEVNGVKISNEIFELGYFVSVDKGKISIFKK